MSRGAKVEVVCARGCGMLFLARVADRKRGWGRFASKSCKARAQEKRTGQYAALLKRRESDEDYGPGDYGHPMVWDRNQENA